MDLLTFSSLTKEDKIQLSYKKKMLSKNIRHWWISIVIQILVLWQYMSLNTWITRGDLT